MAGILRTRSRIELAAPSQVHAAFRFWGRESENSKPLCKNDKHLLPQWPPRLQISCIVSASVGLSNTSWVTPRFLKTETITSKHGTICRADRGDPRVRAEATSLHSFLRSCGSPRHAIMHAGWWVHSSSFAAKPSQRN